MHLRLRALAVNYLLYHIGQQLLVSSLKAKGNSVIDIGLGTFENSNIKERCSVDETGKETPTTPHSEGDYVESY